jgi:hypothetical protein
MSRGPLSLRVLGLSVLITILMSMGAVSAAWAYFTSTGTATAATNVGTLSGAPAGDCPTSTAPTSATSCTDSGLAAGSHSYTVTAVWRSWTAASATTNVSVASGALDHFALVLASPQASGAGFTGTNTLTAQDASGNTVTSFSAAATNVTLTANGALTGVVSGLHGANVLNQAGDFTNGVANLTALGLTYTGNAGTGTFTATSTSGTTGKTGTSANVTITAGALDHFLIQAAAGGNVATQTAGSAFNVKITAQDAANNTVSGFTGAVDVTSNRTCSAGCATTAAFTAGVLSSKSITLTQAGALSTITATDHAGTGKTGTSNTFTVNAGALDHFALVLASPQASGAGFTGTNTLTSFSAAATNVTLTANGALTGVVSGLHGANVLNQAGDFTNGVANLTALGLTYTGNAGTGTFTATSTSGTTGKTGSSANVTITAATLDHFTLVLASPQVSGAGFTATNTLTAQDAAGNTLTSFSAAATNVTLTANGALTGTVSGLHGGSVLNQAGDFTSGVANLTALGLTYTGSGGTGTFTATSTSGTTGKTGTSANVTITGGALDHFLIQAAAGGGIATQTAGSAFNVKITAQDAANNTVSGFTGTVDVTSNRNCSAGCATTGAFTAGVLSSRSITLTQAGALSTITATDHAGTGKTGTSASFTVNPASATKMVFVNCAATGPPVINSPTCTVQPLAMGNNTDMTFNMQTQDPFGNPSAPASAITISFTNSDGTFTMGVGAPASITTAGASSGTVTLHHAVNGGTDTLTATASAGFPPATLQAKK